MPKGKYEARAHFPGRGCTLVVDVDLECGDEAVALYEARRIVRKEFGKTLVDLATWSIKRVDSIKSK